MTIIFSKLLGMKSGEVYFDVTQNPEKPFIVAIEQKEANGYNKTIETIRLKKMFKM